MSVKASKVRSLGILIFYLKPKYSQSLQNIDGSQNSVLDFEKL